MAVSQQIPSSGPGREELRQKGQFWTPDWVADAMVAYVLAGGAETIFDPAVGAGAFLRAAERIGHRLGSRVTASGTEIDKGALLEAKRSGLEADQISHVEVRDFLRDPPMGQFPAIAANPPYMRHHRLPQALKKHLRAFGARLIGRPLDGRTGVHVYFLLQALQILAPAGRLAFIMPADSCEGVFATYLWEWITREYRLEGVVTFTPEATPFPGVDTNPMIYLIRNVPPTGDIAWARCTEPDSTALTEWVLNGLDAGEVKGVSVIERDLQEALRMGLSRPPIRDEQRGRPLGDFASVMRGIATGANDFFFLTSDQVEELHIPDEFLVRAVGRTRDVPGDVISSQTLGALDDEGRPTFLFAPDGRPMRDFPLAVRAYLERGQADGVDQGALISTRQPWYRMETRATPPILFAYLGRRNVRFIRNSAAVVPLTGFLCVYPHSEDADYVRRLLEVLSHPAVIENLSIVGKSYGGGQ
jgi:hypothetical protein